MIQSFSFQAYKWALNSDWLYPSNCKLRTIEDKGSIKDSLASAGIDIFNATEKNSYLHTCGKPIRFLARLIYGIGTETLIAPAGVSYHGFNYIREKLILNFNKEIQNDSD